VNDPPTLVAVRRDDGLLALTPDGTERWRNDTAVGAPIASDLVATVAPEYDPDRGALVALRGVPRRHGRGTLARAVRG
jgi:hypothetical protein